MACMVEMTHPLLARGRAGPRPPVAGAAARNIHSMGFFDALMGGKRKLKLPARDRLFAMTTAQVTLETSLGLKHRNVAGIAFQSLATADFKEIVDDTKELLTGAASDTGTKVETSTDEYGYAWIILRDPDFEDLVVSINTVSSSLEGGGYGDRLLASVFAFE